MTEPNRRVMTTGAACKADVHEWCDVTWCDCPCHAIDEEQSA